MVRAGGTASDDEKMKQLMVAVAKLGLKSAADIRLIANIVYRTAKGPKDNTLLSAGKLAIEAHN